MSGTKAIEGVLRFEDGDAVGECMAQRRTTSDSLLVDELLHPKPFHHVLAKLHRHPPVIFQSGPIIPCVDDCFRRRKQLQEQAPRGAQRRAVAGELHSVRRGVHADKGIGDMKTSVK